MDLLKKSQSALVVTVFSDSYRMAGKIDFNDIELKNNYSLAEVYTISDLYILPAEASRN